MAKISPCYIYIPLAGVVKENDDVRRNFHRKINRRDPCASLLTLKKRQEDLLRSQRKKRSYTKTNTQHWDEGGRAMLQKICPGFNCSVLA